MSFDNSRFFGIVTDVAERFSLYGDWVMETSSPRCVVELDYYCTLGHFKIDIPMVGVTGADSGRSVVEKYLCGLSDLLGTANGKRIVASELDLLERVLSESR